MEENQQTEYVDVVENSAKAPAIRVGVMLFHLQLDSEQLNSLKKESKEKETDSASECGSRELHHWHSVNPTLP